MYKLAHDLERDSLPQIHKNLGMDLYIFAECKPPDWDTLG